MENRADVFVGTGILYRRQSIRNGHLAARCNKGGGHINQGIRLGGG